MTDRLKQDYMNHQDILSEVFSTLRLSSNLYFQAKFQGDFSVEIPNEKRIVRFHLVLEGDCYLKVPSLHSVHLQKGDIAIIPNGLPQSISSATNIAPVALEHILQETPIENGKLNYGSGNVSANLLCGYCSFDETIDHPVLMALPPLIMIQADDFKSDPQSIMPLMLLSLEAELEAPGMTGILSRMLEVIFIQAVRKITLNIENNQGGFIAALSDQKLSKALNAIHNQPQKRWTIEDLSKQAGMSRARFADKFTNVVGVPPINYLTTWRLMISRNLLSNTILDMEEIANRSGYSSASSFSRRFKEAFKIGPGAYRKNKL
jgi:AraC-like DNA-binding protein